jgi:FMN-dependent NADH-azoreductase
MRLLRIDSSARTSSVTRQLTAAFTDAWRRANPDGELLERDLSRTPLPVITDDWSATFGDPAKVTAAQQEYLSTSDTLTAELLAADLIVIGAPMYNFTISWPLKAWIDQVVRLGKTVAYGPSGPRGLLNGKKAIVVTSRGGSYTAEFNAPNFDFQETYLRRILGFMGVEDVTFIHAENQRRGDQAEQARTAAIGQIGRLAAATQRQPEAAD